ncbi:uncharacterized protein At3g27210-like isoform X1 [Typha latifolia]|uniref:uncharacterized protein At3g27210-like isoform X1 n=2 Tax=Typha latifolia TaxID=4733 RepID=UPI003C2C74C3
MGSCASHHKDPGVAMGFRMGIGAKAKRFFVSSPAKEKPMNDGEDPVGGFDLKGVPVESGLGFKSPVFAGSKEEIFFDSRVWLDSDCEDDFFSVNGDFTPSRGSTPNYQSSTRVMPTLSGAIMAGNADSKSEPSPTSRKKLADLLLETLQSEKSLNEQNLAEEKACINEKANAYEVSSNHTLKSVDATPYISIASSVCSSEVTPDRDTKNRKEKTWNTLRCCLPSVVQTFSFDERRPKNPGPCTA